MEDRAQGDVDDRADEDDQEGLAAQPLAEGLVDPIRQEDGPGAVLGRQQLDRPIAEHRPVDEEVERHDQGEDRLQSDLADLTRQVGGIAR